MRNQNCIYKFHVYSLVSPDFINRVLKYGLLEDDQNGQKNKKSENLLNLKLNLN